MIDPTPSSHPTPRTRSDHWKAIAIAGLCLFVLAMVALHRVATQDERTDEEALVTTIEDADGDERAVLVPSSAPVPVPEEAFQSGVASYYADSLAGARTASGEAHDPADLVAAHKELPFGTVLEVENLHNGKTVRVRVNDRGPFTQGRVVDLSKAAASQLGILRSGTAPVEVRVVEE